ncbi:MAG: type VI secretion system protein TssA [Planctomycetaceae bacterium]
MFAVDASPLLEPIPGDSPVGIDLRESEDPNNLYRRIRDDRSDARRHEQDADLDGEPSSEATQLWRQVRDNSLEYLGSQSKDLEIAAYLVESLIRLERFAGLKEGCRILKGLVDNFWGELYPRPDLDYDEGNEATLLPIARLDYDYAIRRITITDDTSVGELCVWQHAQTLLLAGYSPEEQETRIAQGAVSAEMFTRAAAETTPEFFQQAKADLDAAVASVTELSETLDEKAGPDSPNLSKAFEALSDADSALRMVAGNKLIVAEPEAEASEDGDGDDTGSSSGGGGQSVGSIASREDAFRELEKIAAWFEAAEPQSILPAEIRKAVRRGRMSPADLYADLISDESVRDQLYRDVGISANESDSSGDDY